MCHRYFVSHLPLKRLTFRYKKGVENASLSYLATRSWRTFLVDKTIAPHRFAIYFAKHGKVKATNAGAIANLIFTRNTNRQVW